MCALTVRGTSTRDSAEPVTVTATRESLGVGGVTWMVYVPAIFVGSYLSASVNVSTCGSSSSSP